ncbi:hypothetical protein AMECASPLE_006160 [Ameca splendens]|uniref:Uncharacterized protein n=1 Tax=Ameca splendens TaxID=208324 RepID=A0ABV0ZXA4_9TELE
MMKRDGVSGYRPFRLKESNQKLRSSSSSAEHGKETLSSSVSFLNSPSFILASRSFFLRLLFLDTLFLSFYLLQFDVASVSHLNQTTHDALRCYGCGVLPLSFIPACKQTQS